MTDTLPATTTPKRASKMTSNQSLNVNDLLNFTLPPRQIHVAQSFPRRSKRTGAHYGVWNKESQHCIALDICFLRADASRHMQGLSMRSIGS
jgi:hypothetical protein